jgi:Mg2+ and Co2+ transporter CorA
MHDNAVTIRQDIRESLDEKRNFYNYLLAIVTVFLGPMTILTGYW